MEYWREYDRIYWDTEKVIILAACKYWDSSKSNYFSASQYIEFLRYMELNQGEIIQKPKMQELSSLFMTHRINVMHALVKFHEYIPYSLGVMARTLFTICN